PGLFISFILTNYLIRILREKHIYNPWIILLAGIMTGFPNGAYLCAFYRQINPESTLPDKLSGIINIPSPAFLISYVYTYILEKNISIVLFLSVTYLPVLLIAVITVLTSSKGINNTYKNKAARIEGHKLLTFFEESVDASVDTALKLGTYIILFSVIVSVISYLPLDSLIITLLTYPLEISNGLNLIKQLDISLSIRLMAVFFLDAFGGICIIMQTKCVCREYISIKKYIYRKLELCALTEAVALFLIYVLKM
ncbi:MAG: hypothetical protein SO361_10080, partial [Lachnospira sp.]|nr:hypothetical protein [Lachnospira sp.]